MSAEEKKKRVLAWLERMLAERLVDPSDISDHAKWKATILIHNYMMKFADYENAKGFMDGVLLSLIVYNTSPNNVKGLKDAN